MLRKIAFFLLLAVSAQAQLVIGGNSKAGGTIVFQVPGTITPPPPSGIAANFPNSSWNALLPANWPPFGAEGVSTCKGANPTNCADLMGARLWDDGAKWGQLETSNGGWSTAFTNMGTFINTNATVYPMDVLYTFGDTPTWAAQGTDTNCATPTSSSCVPPIHLDVNQSNCNADGSAPPATVHNDCGNGANDIWQAAVYHILVTYPSIDFVECWNEPDGAGNFWTNSASFGGRGAAPNAANQPPLVRLVRLCSDLYHIAHALNPNIKVISPSFHGPTALTWMHYFSTTTVNDPGCSGSCSAAIGGITWAASTVTGKNTFDITNAHLRGSPNADPTNFIGAYNNAITEINNDGLSTILWDDEWGPVNTGTVQTATFDDLAAYVAAGLALRAGTWFNKIPVVREWYYQWDAKNNATQSSGLQGNIAGQEIDEVASWVVGSTPTAACSNAGTIWTCPLKLNGVTPAEIKWNQGASNTCGTSCPTASSDGFSNSWTDLTGTVHGIVGGTVPLGGKAILIQ